jgi:hypothetical protein
MREKTFFGTSYQIEGYTIRNYVELPEEYKGAKITIDPCAPYSSSQAVAVKDGKALTLKYYSEAKTTNNSQ